MLTPRLRERLSRLTRGLGAAPESEPGRAAGGDTPVAPPAAPDEAARVEPWSLRYDVVELGKAVQSSSGTCFRIELDLSAAVPDHAERVRAWVELSTERWGRPEQRGLLDIETAGLSAAPLFLIGLLVLEGGALRLRQCLARDYAEEPAVLAEALPYLEGRRRLVTFNGQSFDLPFILDRAVYHRLPASLAPDPIDLLLLARRVWRHRVPDCRLTTLERYLCGRRRAGDVGGAQIPSLYHDFVRTGNWDLIVPVLWHNAMDLLTMAELAARLEERSGRGAEGIR